MITNEKEREWKRKNEKESEKRERKRERERKHVCVLIGVCVCLKGGEKEKDAKALFEKNIRHSFSLSLRQNHCRVNEKCFNLQFASSLTNWELLDLVSFQVGKINIVIDTRPTL